jgi:DNA-binding ferritin-like protein
VSISLNKTPLAIFRGSREEGVGMKTSERHAALSSEAVAEISETLSRLLADVFCIYLKTKSFHWHMTGRHFRDYHLLLDEHAEQMFGICYYMA